eukprot:gene1888-4982_t
MEESDGNDARTNNSNNIDEEDTWHQWVTELTEYVNVVLNNSESVFLRLRAASTVIELTHRQWESAEYAPDIVVSALSQVLTRLLQWDIAQENITQHIIVLLADTPLGGSICLHCRAIEVVENEIRTAERFMDEATMQKIRSVYFLLIGCMLHCPRTRDALAFQVFESSICKDIFRLVTSHEKNDVSWTHELHAAFLALNWLGGCQVGTQFLLDHLDMLNACIQKFESRVEIILTLANMGAYLQGNVAALQRLARSDTIKSLMKCASSRIVHQGSVGALMGLLSMHMHLDSSHPMAFCHPENDVMITNELRVTPHDTCSNQTNNGLDGVSDDDSEGTSAFLARTNQIYPNSVYEVTSEDIHHLFDALELSLLNEAHGNILWSPWHPCQAIAAICLRPSLIPVLLNRDCICLLLQVLGASTNGRQAEPIRDEQYATKAFRELARYSEVLLRSSRANEVIRCLKKVATQGRSLTARLYAVDALEALDVIIGNDLSLAQLCRRKIRCIFLSVVETRRSEDDSVDVFVIPHSKERLFLLLTSKSNLQHCSTTEQSFQEVTDFADEGKGYYLENVHENDSPSCDLHQFETFYDAYTAFIDTFDLPCSIRKYLLYQFL